MINLLSQVIGYFLKIIHGRIYNTCERDIGSTGGVRQDFGTREALFSLIVLLKKCRNQLKDFVLCYIDYQKALDYVKHAELIKLIQNKMIDENDQICIKKNLQTPPDETTQSFSIENGVRQGCVLYPCLFLL